ncbi:MAG: hypothetical protein UV98_C0006G0015 [Parcubacteria group bacterium GW2011_GWB1_43_6]|nr:MAG: hypothetical protein UV98_C0006G0015 [Parcubacteria group bacterium GW2011_GWB1_43_6]
MVVAVAVFSLLVGATSSIFLSSIKNQKQSLATQEILDQTSYLMEYMSRALRMAKKDMAGSCTGAAKLNYAFAGQCLKFLNYNGACQQFCLEGARLKDENGNYLTSANLQVANFAVMLSGASQPPADYLQPRVTISLNVAGQEQTSIKIQTTVSQRNLDIRK